MSSRRIEISAIVRRHQVQVEHRIAGAERLEDRE